jgi:hypothetical protein
MAAGLPVRPYAGPLGIPEGNEEFGVNQSLPEGVSSPSEAIHAASAHMHVKIPSRPRTSKGKDGANDLLTRSAHELHAVGVATLLPRAEAARFDRLGERWTTIRSDRSLLTSSRRSRRRSHSRST